MGETASFKEIEQRGWEAKASGYAALLGQVTARAVEPLLDATGVARGSRVLDVATGPGYVAAGGAARGAEVVGIDFAADMVAEARRRHPALRFEQGDAENLAFPDASFDAVTCAFGVLHFADPDRAIAEAFRVLRPGGRFAFTVWIGPPRHEFFALVSGAIAAHGDTQVALPPAPPIFRFADAAESRKTLSAVGFAEPAISELPLEWHAESPDAVLDAIYRSTVRTALLLEYQQADVRERIHEAIREGARARARDGAYVIAWPAVLVAARKPG